MRSFARPGGVVALAVKTFLYIREGFTCWAPKRAYLRPDDNDGALAVELLRAVAEIVPEIAELSAAIIHDDAALIAADMDVIWARTVLVENATVIGRAPRQERLSEIEARLAAALNRIAKTEAKTGRGEEIKRRTLACSTLVR